jgi:hypothetical protein
MVPTDANHLVFGAVVPRHTARPPSTHSRLGDSHGHGVVGRLQREDARRHEHCSSVGNQHDRDRLGQVVAVGQGLLGKDEKRHHREQGDVHHAEGKEDGKEEPAAPQTIEAVGSTHADGASGPVLPRGEDEASGK